MADLLHTIQLEEEVLELPPQLEGFSATPAGPTSIDLGWSDPGNNATVYDLMYSEDPDFLVGVTDDPQPPNHESGSFYTVNGLVSGHTYYFIIRSRNNDGYTTWRGASATTP